MPALPIRPMWECTTWNGIVDIRPLNDLIEHIEGPTCQCQPVLHEDWLYVHHSADGREHFESDYDPEIFRDRVI